jgi:cation diffusion facilitator CzcD-associated flavoprotein CzcO
MAQGCQFDVIIIGAGLSGIAAAHYLKNTCPQRSFLILESREAIGGTWDLFRYPGVRSDSDMFTLGYAFRPWKDAKAIADGPSILAYILDTAREDGTDKLIRFGHKVVRAAWSTPNAAWTLEVQRTGAGMLTLSCGFLITCTGYYDYAGGYLPEFPGIGAFKGRLIHPQAWPLDLAYAGKRVVVIGSGATAVTLVPAMARTAAHVTMLQRTPSYVVARPAEDPFANAMRKRLPGKLAYAIVRWRNVLLAMYFFNLARKRPRQVRQRILDWARGHLGPDYDIATHFTPPYDPWDQRLCLVPDGDLFSALKLGKAEIVTDQIDSFTETGMRLRSGRRLEADIVVSATGLQLQMLGGMEIIVDGNPVKFSATTVYRGAMYSGVPNLASCFGYTNASWTLKVDLTCAYVCRILNHMTAHGYASVTPRIRDPDLRHEPLLSFTSGYVQRAIASFPKQGNRPPWRLRQNYLLDILDLRFCKLDDGNLEFERP